MTPIIEEIAAERERQKAVEGWSVEHDDTHRHQELARAAACYALPPSLRMFFVSRINGAVFNVLWPLEWDRKWWKPKDRRRDLVRAGALIVAELERLDRAKVRPADDE